MVNQTRRIALLALTTALLTGCVVSQTHALNPAPMDHAELPHPGQANLDAYTSKEIDTALGAEANDNTLATGQRTNDVSAVFLGTPYRANMLQGANSTPERLVIDFRGLDCFTYLEYVEALRASTSKHDFINQLIQTRYKNGDIGFLSRRHFFSDWAGNGTLGLADDITAQTSPDAVTVEKSLNKKADGGAYLPGLPIVKRTITYIPSKRIGKKVLSRLQTGDYIGLYTPLAGLDVTHVGFFIMTDKGPVLRHASLKKGKVVDLPFLEYVSQKPGIIVYRPKKQPGQRDAHGNVLRVG
ncbi:DUF1460 domain-containing protein [Pseudomonas viridiflava]|nr:DUF1460 domain-containing protein [Pseudomonas viridiflava]